MEKRYYRLKDTSGTYWSVRLDVSFVRDKPLALESSPDLKMLLAKGVIVEISESDYEAYIGLVPGEDNDPDQSGVIVQPTAHDQATEDKNRQFMEAEDVITQKEEEDSPPVDLNVSEISEQSAEISEIADQSVTEEGPMGEGVSDLPQASDSEIKEMLKSAVDSGIVANNRGWFKYADITLGKGIEQAIRKLISEPELLNKLKTELGVAAD